jgi:nucleotide-binding universal stress UspA family protein
MASADPQLPRTIVVGVDSEGRADHAARAAQQLGERFGARVRFVHAFPVAPLFWGRDEAMPEWSAGTEAAASAIRAHLSTTLTSTPSQLDIHVVSGPPAQVILDEMKATGAELVVLGAHHKRGLFDFGSTARGVLAGAPTAVWVQVEPPRPIRRVLVPIDLSEDSLLALARARDLALAFGASLTVMSAFVVPQFGGGIPDTPISGPMYAVDALRKSSREEFDRAMTAFDWRGVAHEARFTDGEPAEEILRLQDGHDLIAMGTHGHTGLSAVLLGNVTYSVLRQARIAVLAIRRPGRGFLT